MSSSSSSSSSSKKSKKSDAKLGKFLKATSVTLQLPEVRREGGGRVRQGFEGLVGHAEVPIEVQHEGVSELGKFLKATSVMLQQLLWSSVKVVSEFGKVLKASSVTLECL